LAYKEDTTTDSSEGQVCTPSASSHEEEGHAKSQDEDKSFKTYGLKLKPSLAPEPLWEELSEEAQGKWEVALSRKKRLGTVKLAKASLQLSQQMIQLKERPKAPSVQFDYHEQFLLLQDLPVVNATKKRSLISSTTETCIQVPIVSDEALEIHGMENSEHLRRVRRFGRWLSDSYKPPDILHGDETLSDGEVDIPGQKMEETQQEIERKCAREELKQDRIRCGQNPCLVPGFLVPRKTRALRRFESGHDPSKKSLQDIEATNTVSSKDSQDTLFCSKCHTRSLLGILLSPSIVDQNSVQGQQLPTERLPQDELLAHDLSESQLVVAYQHAEDLVTEREFLREVQPMRTKSSGDDVLKEDVLGPFNEMRSKFNALVGIVGQLHDIVLPSERDILSGAQYLN
jgi:hypothetical protein